MDGYLRAPQGGDFDRDEWGDPGGMVTALSVEMMRAQAAEEAQGGERPW